MRQKAVVGLGAILVALSCAGVAFAGHMITAEVIWVNPSMQELTVNVEGFPMTFTAIDQAVMALATVAPGDMVTLATDSFTTDFSPHNYHAELADWKATTYSIAKLSRNK
jgi:hypothetical protein